MKNFMQKYDVSCETFYQLKTYQSLLEEWQVKFNLVSSSSIKDAWNRHFLDSAQLFQYIPKEAKNMIDFGSGAGFPGMVLAIMAKEKTPYLKVVLVDSIRKKTVYLKEVAQKTNTSVDIINDRIENIPNQKFDIITSRAMTSLSDLLKYSYPFCHKGSLCIFPKGKNYALELKEAHSKWNFKCVIKASEQSEEGKILIVSNIRKKEKK